MERSHRLSLALLAALGAVILATRGHHLPTPATLGDATLAALFLGGLWLARWRHFAVLLGVAALTDFLAVRAGVSAWCITPGYVGLIPAYAALWWAGRASRGAGLAVTATALAGGVAAFFVVSNAAFYAGSGYFENLPLVDFSTAVVRYLPGYLVSSFVYAAAGLAVAALARLAPQRA